MSIHKYPQKTGHQTSFQPSDEEKTSQGERAVHVSKRDRIRSDLVERMIDRFIAHLTFNQFQRRYEKWF